MRIGVFGTGSVGGYFGGRLAKAGEEVVFIARGEHLRLMQEHGLRVESVLGDFQIQPVQATDDPVKAGTVDVVLLGVKAWQVPESASALRPMVGEHTFVVPLQNGVEAPAQLAEALGKEHVLGGLCRISSSIAAPGLIRHAGIEPYIAFGELDNRPSQRSQQLKAAFDRAGVRAEIPADIHAAMWEKFIFIAAISSVGAAARAPAGAVRSVPETRQLLIQAMEEVAAVARGLGIHLASDTVSRILANIDGMPAGVIPSMQRDILDGRPSELDAQTGAVVRLGKHAGVETPGLAVLYAALLPQELKARGASSD